MRDACLRCYSEWWLKWPESTRTKKKWTRICEFRLGVNSLLCFSGIGWCHTLVVQDQVTSDVVIHKFNISWLQSSSWSSSVYTYYQGWRKRWGVHVRTVTWPLTIAWQRELWVIGKKWGRLSRDVKLPCREHFWTDRQCAVQWPVSGRLQHVVCYWHSLSYRAHIHPVPFVCLRDAQAPLWQCFACWQVRHVG